MFGILTPPPHLYLKNYNKRKVKMQTLMEKGDKKQGKKAERSLSFLHK